MGRECFIGLDAGTPTQAIVASPALECQSRTCLRVPLERGLPEGSEYTNLCTAQCSSDDECDRVPESPCQTGFTCAVPVVRRGNQRFLCPPKYVRRHSKFCGSSKPRGTHTHDEKEGVPC